MRRSFYTTHSGALFVTPGGQSEDGAGMAQAGYSWAAIDVVDGNGWDSWQTSIARFRAAGLRVPVWGRVKNIPNWDPSVLLDVGKAHGCPTILNIEDEFKTKAPRTFEAEIKAWKRAHVGYTREIVINTAGWLYNDVDYSAIAHRPVQLQVMVDDMHIAPADLPRVTADCITHARLKGFRDIGVTFQAFHDASPAWYSFWTKARSYFTGDWIGAQSAWERWPG